MCLDLIHTNKMVPPSRNTATLWRWGLHFSPMLLCLSNIGMKPSLSSHISLIVLPQNCSPMTPLHKLLGTTPDYLSFLVFGCACWPNLHPYNSHKLQLRSTCCAFLGYSNTHKGFKYLDISTGRIYISHDVIFDESVFPFASLNSNAEARYTSDVLLIPSSTAWDNIFTNESNDPTVSVLPFPDIPVQLQQGSILIDV
jgi:hypothetical protein